MSIAITRPFLSALGAHTLFVCFLMAIQAYKSAIPPAREFAPIEVVVIGDVNLEAAQRQMRPRVKLNDLKEGVVVGEQSSGGKAVFGSLLEQAGKVTSGKLQTKEVAQPKDNRGFAMLARTIRDDLFQQSQKQGAAPSFKVIDQLPEKIRGVEWKSLPPPEVKSDAPLSAQELERLRLMFASKWVEIRDCYEQGLLHDDKLSGYVHLQVQVGQEGKPDRVSVDLRGEGNGQSQRVLKSCIANAAEVMKFFEKLRGQVLQVGYRLRS